MGYLEAVFLIFIYNYAQQRTYLFSDLHFINKIFNRQGLFIY